jgi:polyisoprenoid-binding protein YceI
MIARHIPHRISRHISHRRTVYSLAIALLATTLLAAAPLRAADTYKVDPAHATAIFRVNHMGTSWVYGRFDDVSGTFVADDQKPEFDISINADSVDTNNKQRDTHLKSADFFSVKEFPTLTFKSTAATSTGDKKFDVTGDFTLHGVTKSITVPIEFVGAAQSKMMGARAGYEAHFSVKRSDYGMDKMVGPVGDEIFVTVSLEGVKQ